MAYRVLVARSALPAHERTRPEKNPGHGASRRDRRRRETYATPSLSDLQEEFQDIAAEVWGSGEESMHTVQERSMRARPWRMF